MPNCYVVAKFAGQGTLGSSELDCNCEIPCIDSQSQNELIQPTGSNICSNLHVAESYQVRILRPLDHQRN